MIRMIFQRRGDKNRRGLNNPNQLTDPLNKTTADLQPAIRLTKKCICETPRAADACSASAFLQFTSDP